MKLKLTNKLSRNISKTGLKIKKYSPEIMIVAGITGVVTSTIMACKATTKLSSILDSHKESIENIHNAMEHPEELPEEYTEKDGKKDLTIIYSRTALEIAKLYAPSFILGALSIGTICTSNNILRKRNLTLAAAYTAIDKNFKEYRGRVVERFGDDVDRELRYNIKKEEIKEKKVDENGKEKTVKNKVEVINNIPGYSDYAKFFDASCLGWEKDADLNLMQLKRIQDQANDDLQRRGHLFLNEVYDMLGIPRTRLGQVAGWIYDEENPNGDNRVDFGIYDKGTQANARFVNGYEPTILLDFNCDGRIIDLL